MPNTYPCADTRCTGRTLVNGTPCPDCQRRIDRENAAQYDREKEQRRKDYEHKKGNGK